MHNVTITFSFAEWLAIERALRLDQVGSSAKQDRTSHMLGDWLDRLVAEAPPMADDLLSIGVFWETALQIWLARERIEGLVVAT